MPSKRILASLILSLSILLAACGPAPTDAGPAQSGTRRAVLTETFNDVRTRLAPDREFAPASEGLVLPAGGQAQTGEDSRARFDLQPEGTIVRLGPNSSFEMSALDEKDAFTRLKLAFGELWIILNGGALEVESETGQAAVRGSYLGLILSPDSGSLKALCLEGFCTLSNALGSVELTGGQAAEIPAPGQPPSAPRPMREDEFRQWQEASPEAASLPGPQNPPPTGDQPTPPSPLNQPTPGNGTPESPPPPPPGGNSSSTYDLKNTCQEVWHWKFEGPTTVEFDVPPGESASGTLPPGDYNATDWFDNGISHGPNFLPGGGHLEVTSCPEGADGP
ncbi:MAG: FecR family protein [Chloroflexota bacterium]